MVSRIAPLVATLTLVVAVPAMGAPPKALEAYILAHRKGTPLEYGKH